MNPPKTSLPFHYAWVIVLCGGLTIFSCLGLARFAFGMLLPAMKAGLGLGYDQMGYVSTGNFAGYLVSVALAPLLLRRARPRVLITGSLLLIALCMVGISQTDSFLPLLVFYTLVGMGGGFANIPAVVLISHWFRRERRGRAAGLMIMGNGAAIIFSGYLIPTLNESLGMQGWRTGWLILAAITLGAAACTALLVHNDPAELGLEPLGARQSLEPAAVAEHSPAGSGRSLLLLGVLYLIFGATYMVYGTFIVTAMVAEFGLAEARAGLLWSWVGVFSLFSGIGFGALSDRFGRKTGLMAVFVIQSLAYLLAGSSLGEGALVASVVLYGLSTFAIPTIMAAAVGDLLGLSRAAAGFSLITVFFAVGQTLGPASAGVLAENSGTFTTAFLLSGGLTGLAVLLASFLAMRGGGHLEDH